MFHYVHPPERTSDTSYDDDEFLAPHDLGLAFDLWAGYQNGLLPRAGGLLDQSPQHRALFHAFNERYNYFVKLTPDEVEAQRYKYADDLDPTEIAGDTPAVTSFDAFRRG